MEVADSQLVSAHFRYLSEEVLHSAFTMMIQPDYKEHKLFRNYPLEKKHATVSQKLSMCLLLRFDVKPCNYLMIRFSRAGEENAHIWCKPKKKKMAMLANANIDD